MTYLEIAKYKNINYPVHFEEIFCSSAKVLHVNF